MKTKPTTKRVRGWAVMREGTGEIGLVELDYEAKGDERDPNLAYSIHPTKAFALMSKDEGDKLIEVTITYSLKKK